ncbi:MAG: c-type cytochrome [Methylococcaceae bacterium]|nr:c-type cytochrome [Methylococcaceae bacterium]
MKTKLRLLLVSSLILGGCSGAKLAQKPDYHRGMHVFNVFCAPCHQNPSSDAPQLDEEGDWDLRAIQWTSIWKQHVTQGFLGMPAKAGHPELAEQDINDALYYIEIKVKSLE